MGGRTAQSFGVAAKSKVRIYGLLNQIAQIFEVERGQMPGFVLNAHGTEGPIQFVQFGKAMRFG